MFFIFSINVKKNTARIVGHSDSVEDAIQKVQHYAKQYIIRKNEPVLHRTAENNDLKFTEQVHYYTKDCPTYIHQIDVFRQQTKKIKGWTRNTYKEHSQLVRRFSYYKYDLDIDFLQTPKEKEEIKPPFPSIVLPRVVKSTSSIVPKNTLGGFPSDIMTSLRESEAFKRHKITAEKNRLPPTLNTHTFFESSSEDDSLECSV